MNARERSARAVYGCQPPMDLGRRRAWIDHFAKLVGEREGSFVECVGAELDRAPWEVFSEEIEPLLAACRWHRRRGLSLLAPRRIAGRAWWQFGQRHRRVRLPRGRVAIIATWNYPVQLLGIQLVQAVAAGNRVVVKPSEHAPRSQSLLVRCAIDAAKRAGLGEQWIRVTEPTREAGRRLLAEERFDFVIFTGSTEVGREVARECARTLTPSALELSGRDSAIVLDDADTTLAARSLWHALSMNGGQTCMAPRRVLVTRGARRAFVAALAPLAAAARPRRLVSSAAAERAWRLADDAVSRGARSVSGVHEAPFGDDGRSMRALAIVDCPADAPLVEGRHFGPVMAVVTVADEAEAISVHGRFEQRLATSVYTRRAKRWLDPAQVALLGSGVVTVNDAILPTGHPGASIAGVGESGWSATRGEAGLLALSREVVVSTTSRWIRTPIDAPSAAGQRWLRAISRLLGAAGSRA